MPMAVEVKSREEEINHGQPMRATHAKRGKRTSFMRQQGGKTAGEVTLWCMKGAVR